MAFPHGGQPAKPFSAYTGDEPFVFVSYAHRDSETVYADIGRLHDAGYRIWYDEGIEPGSEWPENVAKALNGCSLFLLFLSPSAVDSRNVRNEIHLAISRKKPMLIVHLEPTELPPGLELQLGAIQAVMRYGDAVERYYERVDRAFAGHENLRGHEPRVKSVASPRSRVRGYAIAATVTLVVVVGSTAGWWFVGRSGEATFAGRADTSTVVVATVATALEYPEPTARDASHQSSVRAEPGRAATPVPVRQDLPPSTSRARGIPDGAVVCASGPNARAVQAAVVRALGERSVRVVPYTAGTCDGLVAALVGSGVIPTPVSDAPEARAYVAIEVVVTIEDSTYWMASAEGRVAVASVGGGRPRVQRFNLAQGRTGVQPDRTGAIRASTTDLVAQNSSVFEQLADQITNAR